MNEDKKKDEIVQIIYDTLEQHGWCRAYYSMNLKLRFKGYLWMEEPEVIIKSKKFDEKK